MILFSTLKLEHFIIVHSCWIFSISSSFYSTSIFYSFLSTFVEMAGTRRLGLSPSFSAVFMASAIFSGSSIGFYTGSFFSSTFSSFRSSLSTCSFFSSIIFSYFMRTGYFSWLIDSFFDKSLEWMLSFLFSFYFFGDWFFSIFFFTSSMI